MVDIKLCVYFSYEIGHEMDLASDSLLDAKFVLRTFDIHDDIVLRNEFDLDLIDGIGVRD